ncbi:acyl-CoA thioesterase [Kitasatospora kifunensis]|uniref:Acyl-CoA thioesterase FadM n=1 Tax=Kitasatospora kifunensis TaxID=58351 RepID=A0A7W7R7S0_KITKI|nr:thioesterase family protein [Kitasatospora kifunensis]MBB4926977.1 acyl-CoA thioesterase FadM [Kitasatospora kifunensis]
MTTHRNAHVLRCPTRWSDVDQNGHINNARLVGYIQEGIYDLFHHHAQAVQDSLFSAGFLIARHEIDYLEQLHHRPEPLLVRLTVERLGRSSAHVRVDVCRDPFTYMTARTVVVARDRASGRSRKLSQPERRFLSDYLTVTPSVLAAAKPRVPSSPVAAAAKPRRVTPSVLAGSKPLAARGAMTHQSTSAARPGVAPRGQGQQARKVPLPSRLPARVLCRA